MGMYGIIDTDEYDPRVTTVITKKGKKKVYFDDAPPTNMF